DEPLLGDRPHDVPVADFVLGGSARVLTTAPVHRLHLDDVMPGLAAEGAGIHGESPAESSRNAREELRRTQAPLDALLGEPRTGHAGLAVHGDLIEAVQPIERAERADDDARQAPVANQQIAAETDPVNGHLVAE